MMSDLKHKVTRRASSIYVANYKRIESQLPNTKAQSTGGGLGLHGTFTPNKIESVHRWYPYLEGFSSTFVEDITSRWAAGPVNTIYDPFGGTGTALTVAAVHGIKGLFSEINPFMRHVIECKTNVLSRVALKSDEVERYFTKIADVAISSEKTLENAEEELAATFPGKPYFAGRRLVEILALKQAIETTVASSDLKMLARLALASIGVASSEMKRQADLRYRTEREVLPTSYSVYDSFRSKCTQIVSDISPEYANLAETYLAGSNAVEVNEYEGEVDFIVTSPPYLNGTNYFRNTKIELWLSGYIQHERELSSFTQQAMIAGINNVSRNSRASKSFEFVELVARELDEVAYDKRIPAMVRGYCSDTELWISNCIKMMRNGARLVIDIGDSRFAGVDVPTDEFIIQIASDLGLKLLETELVRLRKSKDGSPLKQVLLVFEKVEG